MRPWLVALTSLFMISASGNAGATGLRGFVALPVHEGGGVARVLYDATASRGGDDLGVLAGAWGLTADHTILASLPYRLDGTGDGFGDPSVLWRPTVWRRDRVAGTTRLAPLAGLVVATDGRRDSGLIVGGVFSHFRGRVQFDVDALYVARGLPGNLFRWDVALDVRLAPRAYPEWGDFGEWRAILEFGGRDPESGSSRQHVITGLRYTRRSWMLEAGYETGLGTAADRWLASWRVHF